MYKRQIEGFLAEHPPTASCIIEENTSWSCAHGVERWRGDCGGHTGGEPGWNQKWRGPLREAFDNLAAKTDELFEEKISVYGDPWKLRNEAVDLYKCGLAPSAEERAERRRAFVTERFGDLSEEVSERIAGLIEMERMRMFAYTSCAWFFNDVAGVETRQVISYALRAAQIAEESSGRDFIRPLLEDLRKARGNTRERPTAAAVAIRDIMPRMREQSDMKTKGEQNTDGSEKMNGMNYGTNLANSLLATLEHDPAFRNTAYFSMEIALMPEIPTYSGGLGVLAGDILKSASDLGVPMVAMTLLYKKGYFAQKINREGRQTEYPVEWNPRDFMTQLPNRVTITMNGRPVTVGAWCYMLIGQTEHPLPIYFLDTDLPENLPEDRLLTAELYLSLIHI